LAPCNAVVGYQRFRGPRYLQVHPEDGGRVQVHSVTT